MIYGFALSLILQAQAQPKITYDTWTPPETSKQVLDGQFDETKKLIAEYESTRTALENLELEIDDLRSRTFLWIFPNQEAQERAEEMSAELFQMSPVAKTQLHAYETILAQYSANLVGHSSAGLFVKMDELAPATRDAFRTQRLVQSRTVSNDSEGVMAIRLLDVELEENVELSITNPISGYTETFELDEIVNSNGTSSFFEGREVTISLIDNRTIRQSPIVLDSLILERIYMVPSEADQYNAQFEDQEDTNVSPVPESSPVAQTTCGRTDDRVQKKIEFIGRVSFLVEQKTTEPYCTAFMLEGGLGATAGHCLDTDRSLIRVEFNVPDSRLGSPKLGSLEDVYPLVINSIKCRQCEEVDDPERGLDWGIFQFGHNLSGSSKDTPFDAYGSGFSFAEDATNQDEIEIAGYGMHTNRKTTRTLQSATGEMISITKVEDAPVARVLNHKADTNSGSSGSPILAVKTITTGEEKLVAIGIHTHGDCHETNNYGTSFQNGELSKLYEEMTANDVNERGTSDNETEAEITAMSFTPS
ncbi:MAG: trypsin-like serine protease [Henriciella sp.]|nr:trypsin-like serine protease [Henriciella sp.]